MWMPLLYLNIAEIILFPRRIATLIWLSIGFIMFSVGAIGYISAPNIDSTLTEAVCTIDASKDDNRCASYAVTYLVGTQNYSGPAYSRPSGNECFGTQRFEINNQYYCWYLTNNPGTVYLNKNATHRTSYVITYGLLIILLSMGRLIYLYNFKNKLYNELFKNADYYKRLSNTGSLPKQSHFINALNHLYEFFLTTILGLAFCLGLFIIILGIQSAISPVNTYLFGKQYELTSCAIMDVVNSNDVTELNMSYKVKKLTYTSWITTDMNYIYFFYHLLVPADYRIGSKVSCYYAKDSPTQLKFMVSEDLIGGLLATFFGIMITGLVWLASVAIFTPSERDRSK